MDPSQTHHDGNHAAQGLGPANGQQRISNNHHHRLSSQANAGGMDPLELLRQQQMYNQQLQLQLIHNQIQASPYGLQSLLGNAHYQTLPMSMAPQHRRNQSAFAMGSTHTSNSFEAPQSQGELQAGSGSFRDSSSGRGGRGGGHGHVRRQSLAVTDARRAAEAAQQRRTTDSFQFPGPAVTATSGNASEDQSTFNTDLQTGHGTAASTRGGRVGGHGRSQSMAVPPLRGVGRGATSFDHDLRGRRSSTQGHGRSRSRNFDGNWRAPQPATTQQGMSMVNPNPLLYGVNVLGNNQSFPSLPIAALQALQLGQPQPGLAGLHPGHNSQLTGPLLNHFGQLGMADMGSMNAMNPLGQPVGQHQHRGSVSQQGQQQGQQGPQRKPLFDNYVTSESLTARLDNGTLVRGLLRVNRKNRSDAYVTVPGNLFEADIFICGSKDRNRALQGDLVAVELLDVREVWAQKREKEEKKKRKDLTDGRSASSNGPTDQSGAFGDDGVTLDGAIRRRGSLRQRPTQKRNDDVEVEGQTLLLLEEEELSDEQMPLYAGHVVCVINRHGWQLFSGTLGLLRPSSQATKDKQDAERGARDAPNGRSNDNRGQHDKDKPKIVWFKPTDKRVPLMAIPTDQAPRDFVANHQQYSNNIFVAALKRWPMTSLHPFGALTENLGKMGDPAVELEALLRDNNFGDDGFGTMNTSLTWSLDQEPADALASRRDFRDEKVYALAMDDSQMMSNAIHVKALQSGKFEIGFHVCDVEHFLKPGTPIDNNVSQRGVALHLLKRTWAMLPSSYATDICSFVPDKDRLAISVVFTVRLDTCVVDADDVSICKSIVKAHTKLSLDELDKALSGELEDSAATASIQALEAITTRFWEARLAADEGVKPLRLFRQLDDENIPMKSNIFTSSRATEMIDELTVKVNTHVARRLKEGMRDKALLRRHAGPNSGPNTRLAGIVRRLGCSIDVSSSSALQNSLFKIEDDDVRQGVETLVYKTMPKAEYVVGCEAMSSGHYALDLPLYTHFTRPTRRYFDLLVHRQISAILLGTPYTETVAALEKHLELCNPRRDSAQACQEQVMHMESCRVMSEKRRQQGSDLISVGVVVEVYESAFDVVIPEWGYEKRVHCDQLPLKKAEFRKSDRTLELYWEQGVSSSTFVPEDERPKPFVSQRSHTVHARSAAAAEAERAKTEREEALRRQTATDTVNPDEVNALFDDEDDNGSDTDATVSGVPLDTQQPARSAGESSSHPAMSSSNASASDSARHAHGSASKTSASVTNMEQYKHLFKLRQENGDFIQEVRQLMKIPVILRTDLTKSPPCLTIRSVNPYAL